MGKVVKENYSQKQKQIAKRAKLLQKYLCSININSLTQKNYNKLYSHCETIAEYISDFDEISNGHPLLEK